MSIRLLALLALLSACASAAPEPDGSPIGTVSVSEADLGARIDAFFLPLVQTGDLSGTLVVARRGEPVLVRHYGYSDWDRQKPHTPRTLYAAASVTKGITAATLVALQRDGTVSLGAPVSRWLPALQPFPEVTLGAVLRHRAGLPRDLPDGFDPSERPVSAWLAAHADQIGPSGEERYSNVGYALLAEVVTAAAGEPFAEVARRRVLEPAGMTSSAVLLDAAARQPGGALPYTPGPEPDAVMPAPPTGPEVGSSGLVTTAPDLARWARTLAQGAYPELFESDDPLGSIDTGTDENGPFVSVQGTLPGYVSNAAAWREGDLSISFAGNLFSYPALGMGQVLRALVGTVPPAPLPPRPPAVTLGAEHLRFIGNHEIEGLGPVRISRAAVDGSLVLTRPGMPAAWTFHLTPIASGALHWRAFDLVLRADGSGRVTSRQR